MPFGSSGRRLFKVRAQFHKKTRASGKFCGITGLSFETFISFSVLQVSEPLVKRIIKKIDAYPEACMQ